MRVVEQRAPLGEADAGNRPQYRLHTDPRSSHQQIARLLRELKQVPILDVGAAQGFLGRLLSGSGLVIDAIEPNPLSARDCKPYYRHVEIGTVEDATFLQEKYRVIVCADVLEHTVDPVSVLSRLRTAAADDAICIISLPNIAHFSIRFLLMIGKFPMMDRGILDRTHLHFFTRKTAREMLGRAGLEISRVVATGVPLDEVWKNGERNPLYRLMLRLQHALVTLWPRLFAFQFVFVATAVRGLPSSD